MKVNKFRKIKLMILFFFFASFINMGASCNHENEDGSNIWSQVGGIDSTTGDVVTHSTPDLNLTQAIKYFAEKDYDSALVSFEKVLVTNPNNEELAKGYAGIGWSKVKKSGSILDGEKDFELAYAAKTSNNDARVGMASAYLLKDKIHIREAVQLLEAIGRSSNTEIVGEFDKEFVYNSEIGTGISNARVHALLAACYYFNNQSADSETQIAIAKRLDPESDKVRSIETAILTLGY